MATETSRKRSRASESELGETPVKKQMKASGSALDSLFPTTDQATADTEDFRIIVGTYERILYGINAVWEETTEGDETIHRLKLDPVFIIPAHTGLIRTVSVGGHFLASGSTDEIIRLYDVKKRKEYGSLGGHHQGDITDIKFHGRYMFSASEDKTICLWRTKDWEYLKTLKGHKGRVNAMAIHPTGKIALSVSTDKTVIVWNLMTAHKASVNKLKQEGLSVQWNKAGDRYTIMFDKQLNVYDVSDAEVKTTITHTSRFLCMQYYTSPADEKEYLISGHEDKTVRFWDALTGDLVTELKGHKMRIKAVSLVASPRSEGDVVNVLVSVSSDGVIKCWDIENRLAAVKESKDKSKDDSNASLLGEYNTKSRATCCTTHLGFQKHLSADE